MLQIRPAGLYLRVLGRQAQQEVVQRAVSMEDVLERQQCAVWLSEHGCFSPAEEWESV